MALSDLMMSGVELMVLGMGIVFVFLTILIFTLRGMCALAAWLDKGEAHPIPSGGVTVTDAGAADSTLIAVISAAVARYRSTHKA